MATHAKTAAEIFHSPDHYLAAKSNRKFPAKTLARNHNLALQAFAHTERLLDDAKKSLAAEIFRGGDNRRSSQLEQADRPIQGYTLAFAAICREGHCGHIF